MLFVLLALGFVVSVLHIQVELVPTHKKEQTTRNWQHNATKILMNKKMGRLRVLLDSIQRDEQTLVDEHFDMHENHLKKK